MCDVKTLNISIAKIQKILFLLVSNVLLHEFVWRKSQAAVNVRSWEEISVSSILCVKVACVCLRFLLCIWTQCDMAVWKSVNN